MLRKLLPTAAKIKFRLLRRALRDLTTGAAFSFAQNATSTESFPHAIELSQAIKRTASTQAKINNLAIAIQSIEPILVQPNEIFSFWKAVGDPSLKRGFVESRSLINGELEPSIGGGLCQLAGLIYYVSLQANLDMVERSSHSADIYTEETRFTPLGSDAAVAYAYQDLRVVNSYDFPVKFTFSLTEDSITIRLNSTQEIKSSKVEFESEHLPNNKVAVTTLVNGKAHTKSTYKKVVAS